MKRFDSVKCLLIVASLVFYPLVCRSEPDTAELKPFTFAGPGKSGHTTTIDLVGLSRCMFGDMDSLLLELKAAEGLLGLQLSVETVGIETGETYYGLAMEKKSAASNMGSYQLTLPQVLTPRLYGVFLCTIDEARAAQSPCSAQALKTSSELSLPYRADTGDAFSSVPMSKPTVSTAEQKFNPTIFYAQFFVVNREGAAILTNVASSSLTKTLLRFGFSKESIPKLTNAIKRYTDTINSLPLDLVDGRLQMQLPYYDQGRCLGN